jgi:hypothetical protein
MSEQEHKDAVYQACKDNHIWLNAMSCINPSDEFLLQLGRAVLHKLLNKDCLAHSGPFVADNDSSIKANEAMKFFAEQPKLFLSINKS